MLINSDVNDYSVQQGIQWKFIVELAGFYERLVGITKRALRAVSA